MIRQIILAYGREEEHQRAIAAVLSFWAWYDGDKENVQTVVFTDHPDVFTPYFAGLPIKYHLLTPANMAYMRGTQKYIHRIKLCIIEQVAQEHPGDGLFFCDSDTFFVAPAAPLLKCLQLGYSVMHTQEHSFEEAITTWASFSPPQDKYPRKIVEFLKNRTFELLPGTSHRFRADQMMWNSGVIGLAPDSSQLMHSVLALSDEFYSRSGWILCEQVAFSLALQTETELLSSNKYVFHYWDKRQKAVMDSLLSEVLPSLPPAESLDKRLARIQKLTGNWRRAVRKDDAQQAATLAFSRGEIFNGIKFTAKKLLSNIISG